MAGSVDILLVENDPNDVELVMHALKRTKAPHTLMTVHDGEEALNYIFGRGDYSQRDPDEKPRLILLDLRLPKVDGLEVLSRLKSDTRTRAIPVVILTSSLEERDIMQTYSLGSNSYIAKPIDFDEFSEAIGEVVEYWLGLNQTPDG